MIKDRLSILPTRPVLFIVPVVVVLVLFFYYREQYTKCTGIKQYRASLNELLLSMDAGQQFRLADSVGFVWNKVRIVTRVEPDTITDPCPFDWNWASGERDSLVANGLLTALIFGLEGKVVGYFELRSDEIEFRGADNSLTPDTALFDLSLKAGRDGAKTLTLKR